MLEAYRRRVPMLDAINASTVPIPHFSNPMDFRGVALRIQGGGCQSFCFGMKSGVSRPKTGPVESVSGRAPTLSTVFLTHPIWNYKCTVLLRYKNCAVNDCEDCIH